MREYHPSLRHLATCSHVIGWVHGGNGHFLLTGVWMHVFPLLPKDSGPNFFFYKPHEPYCRCVLLAQGHTHERQVARTWHSSDLT